MNNDFKTLFVGQKIEFFEHLPSTNLYALDVLAKSKPNEGTVISTANQYDGRGQIGSKWFSEPHKNITLSIILYPTFLPIQQQFYLNMAVAVAIAETVEAFVDKKVYIKWSNDIYIENKKVCGVLIQNSISGRFLQSTVIGIGINVNQTEFEEGTGNPTSLAIAAQKNIDIPTLQSALFHFIEANYLLLRAERKERLKDKYLARLYQFNDFALYERTKEATQFEGKIIGVSEIGELLLENRTGEIERFNTKEIRFC